MTTWLFRGIPTPALVLGLGGLVPFVAFSALAVFGPGLGLDGLSVRVARHVLTAYAAVILSFMGGVNWGQAMAAPTGAGLWRRLAVSVVPALVAWVVFVVPFEDRTSLMGLALALGLLLAYDLWAVRRGEAPGWYAPLRVMLSSVACGALLLAAVA